MDAVLGKSRQLIADNGGSVKAEDNWAKIASLTASKREDFAVYVSMDVELPADALLKISNALNISDEVIRYLLVKIDHKARAALAEAKKRAAERETESGGRLSHK